MTRLNTYTVTVFDDAIEEVTEFFFILLRGETSAGADGVTVDPEAGAAVQDIIDDEPAAKLVSVTSEGEAMQGDQYFVVVAGSDSPALNVSGINGATVSAGLSVPINNMVLAPIADVAPILVGMHGLGDVRGKAATHVMLFEVDENEPRGQTQFTFNLSYTSGSLPGNYDFGAAQADSDEADSTVLDVVGSRTNRNFFLSDGMNFTGLGLVPDDPKIANLLKQEIHNAYPGFEDAIEDANGTVNLGHFVETMFAHRFTAGGGFTSYSTPDPITGDGPVGGDLTDLAPFQGTLIRTRTMSQGVQLFDMVDVDGFDEMQRVPVRMNVEGDFSPVTASAPPRQSLRNGFNLLAMHVSGDTPFDTAFGGTGLQFGSDIGSAVSRKREVVANYSGGLIWADIVDGFVTESSSVGDIAPGVIEAEIAYWVHIVGADPQTFVSATGPNSVQ